MFFVASCDDFTEVKSICEVLKELKINVTEYENALKSTDDNSYYL